MSDPQITDPAAFATGLTGDDMVTPFEVKPLDVRGRLVRLGPAITTLLDRHGYPDEVSGVLAEAPLRALSRTSNWRLIAMTRSATSFSPRG